MCDHNQEEYIGVGSINHLDEIIKKTKADNVFLVTGKQSYISSGAKKKIDQLSTNIKITQFNKFDVNPKLEDIYSGISLLKKDEFDLVIAVGGGSVIDMAKSINLLAVQQDDNITKYIKDGSLIRRKGLPLVAIPTTSGSGSESTHFAVIYLDKIKYSLTHKFVIPAYAIVDAELSFNLPKDIAAVSGIDALSHAIESYWSVKSVEESKSYAVDAIKLALGSLKKSVDGDIEAKIVMSKAAHLAGKAINITTTTAAHAISYPFTTYFNIPHGHAVALILGEMFIINSHFITPVLFNGIDNTGNQKIMDTLYEMFGVNSAYDCKTKWHYIMKSLCLETDLNKLGVSYKSDIPLIIKAVNIHRLNNNPIKLSNDVLSSLLSSVFNRN